MENWIDSHITLPEHVTLSEEMENSLSHFIGFIISLIGLLYVAGYPGHSTAMVVFAITNAVMFGASGLYHYLQKGVLKNLLHHFRQSGFVSSQNSIHRIAEDLGSQSV